MVGERSQQHVAVVSPRTITTRLFSATTTSIDLQSSFGRGEQHLSALLEEGDIVAYQTGSWFVDGVLVGDGDAPMVAWAIVDTIQLVWTHNCEHGVVRGWEVVGMPSSTHQQQQQQQHWCWRVTGEMIELGPEQLLARVPSTSSSAVVVRRTATTNDDDDTDPLAPGTVYESLVPLGEEMTHDACWLLQQQQPPTEEEDDGA